MLGTVPFQYSAGVLISALSWPCPCKGIQCCCADVSSWLQHNCTRPADFQDYKEDDEDVGYFAAYEKRKK
jgi:hypothetical protein